MKLLFIRPDKDAFLEYTILTKPVSEYAKRKGYRVVELEGDLAVREAVEEVIETFKPDIIYGIGHGQICTYTGQYLNRIFCGNCDDYCNFDNTEIVKGVKHVHLLSCLTGQKLLPKMTGAGCESASGYFEKWLWVIDPDYEPGEDPFAISFFECDNYFMYRIFEGDSVDDAYRKTYDYYTAKATAWVKWLEEHEDADPETRARVLASIKLLLHDRNALVFYGRMKPKFGEIFFLFGMFLMPFVILKKE